mmetsp:Transcript_16415/g.34301  ORF Transcript_16415/g.34301 Transcript_16415/m.34301 type:complete len:454 (-) Transcript_16415:75-1436(-)
MRIRIRIRLVLVLPRTTRKTPPLVGRFVLRIGRFRRPTRIAARGPNPREMDVCRRRHRRRVRGILGRKRKRTGRPRRRRARPVEVSHPQRQRRPRPRPRNPKQVARHESHPPGRRDVNRPDGIEHRGRPGQDGLDPTSAGRGEAASGFRSGDEEGEEGEAEGEGGRNEGGEGGVADGGGGEEAAAEGGAVAEGEGGGEGGGGEVQVGEPEGGEVGSRRIAVAVVVVVIVAAGRREEIGHEKDEEAEGRPGGVEEIGIGDHGAPRGQVVGAIQDHGHGGEMERERDHGDGHFRGDDDADAARPPALSSHPLTQRVPAKPRQTIPHRHDRRRGQRDARQGHSRHVGAALRHDEGGDGVGTSRSDQRSDGDAGRDEEVQPGVGAVASVAPEVVPGAMVFFGRMRMIHVEAVLLRILSLLRLLPWLLLRLLLLLLLLRRSSRLSPQQQPPLTATTVL